MKDAAGISVRTSKGEFAARVVKLDILTDLAVLKVDVEHVCLPVSSSRKVSLGDKVFTIGFPQRGRRVINSLAGEFQISVPLQPGNSGGPVSISRKSSLSSYVNSFLTLSKMKEADRSRNMICPDSIDYFNSVGKNLLEIRALAMLALTCAFRLVA